MQSVQRENAYAYRQSRRSNVRRAIMALALLVPLYLLSGLFLDVLLTSVWRGWAQNEALGEGLARGGFFARVFTVWSGALFDHLRLNAFPLGTLVLLGWVGVRTFWRLRNPLTFYCAGMTLHSLDTANPSERRLAALFDEVRVAMGLRYAPMVLISHDSPPNAFSVSFEPQHSFIVVSKRLLEVLEDNELRAVLAHEMAHIEGGDCALELFLVSLTYWFAPLWTTIKSKAAAWSARRKDPENRSWLRSLLEHDDGWVLALYGVLHFVALLGFIVFTLAVASLTLAFSTSLHLIQRLGKLLNSRSREYLADAAAVHFLRDNRNLARALLRLHLYYKYMPASELLDAGSARRLSDYFFDPELSNVESTHFWHPQPSAFERIGALGVTNQAWGDLVNWRPPRIRSR